MKETRFRNGIRYPPSIKEDARRLRRDGRTHREIVKELGVSLGSADLWTKGIVLSSEQKSAVHARAAFRSFSPERRAKLSNAAKIRLAPYRTRYTKKDLLNKIVDFYKENERIPLKRGFNMYAAYKRHFGGWNQAIRMAGFPVNPELFAHKFKSKDGHRCDSFTEMVIDDWLYEGRIHHRRNWKYAGTKMTADFIIQSGIVVEFFGLSGAKKKYDKIIERKKEFCAIRGLRLIEIYPRDIFPVNHLGEKFSFLS